MKKLKQVFLTDISPFFKKEVKFKKVKLNKGFLYFFILVVFILGVFLGSYYSGFLKAQITGIFGSLEGDAEAPFIILENKEEPQTYITQEQAVVSVVKSASPSVVSIIITQEVPVYEQYIEKPFGDFFDFGIPRLRQKGTEKQVVGGGTGFIISSDGLVLTNKHVVLEEDAEYTVVLSSGEKYEAQVLARDPFQDLAVLKIAAASALPVLRLGNSDNLQRGQSVIAIGNALGEFSNSVSVGVVSGLGRTINASGGGMIETLEDVIQTDAAINRGNSGGPLLNLKGEVVGVNVAVAESAQNIGFAIPINKAKRAIAQVKSQGRIVYPFLGVRYVVITPEIQESEGLPVDKGVLIIRGSGVDEPAIVPGSAAEKAGLKENDIILELNGKEITLDYPLSKAIQRYYAGDRITLKVLRDGKEILATAVLGESASD